MLLHSTLRACAWATAVVVAGVAFAQPADPMAQRRTAVVDVFEKTKDAVVNISSTQVVELRSGGGIESLFEDFFDLPRSAPRRRVKRTSVGSGFVIHAAGYVVTNAHVVARTTEQKVIFADGSEHDAQLVAMDETRDLAVLKMEPDPSKPLKALPLGASSDLMVGETVIAIGNPLGYQNTVTAGVISALDRTLEVNEQVAFEGLIQTDASINPGNSGGPLLNVLGQLIGVNTAIRADAQNIGFAIPVDQLRQLLPEMLDVERRYRISTGMRISSDGRQRVVSIDTNGPAAKAGITIGDVVTEVNSQPVRDAIDYHIALLGAQPGDVTHLTLKRGDQTVWANVELTQRPLPDGAALLKQRFGITAEPVTQKTEQRLGFELPGGLVVSNVESNSPASDIRMQKGDIIVQIGRFAPQSMEDVGQLLERVGPGEVVPITVLRPSGRVIYRTSTALRAR